MRDRGKYRGQRKDNGEWVYGDLIQKNGRAWIVTEFETPKSIKCGGLQILATTYEVIPETVGESTGIQDKNGVEIYAGNKAKKTYDGCFDGEVTGEIKFKPTKGYYLDCSHKKQFITKTTFDGNFSEEETIVRKASLTCADVRIEVIDIHEEKP